jgi:hypothetical protein
MMTPLFLLSGLYCSLVDHTLPDRVAQFLGEDERLGKLSPAAANPLEIAYSSIRKQE